MANDVKADIAHKSAEMVVQWVKERANIEQMSPQAVSYREYLRSTERIYAEVLESSGSNS